MTAVLDPGAAAFIGELRRSNAPRITGGTPERARALQVAFSRRFGMEPIGLTRIEDVVVPTTTGGIPARLYGNVVEARALVVYLHGGGWVLGGIDEADPFCRLLARDARVAVLNVEYRLAPEAPHPAGVEDAWSAVCWAASTLAPSIPLIIAGDSAGGNLAAVVAQRARLHRSPNIALQVLLYPVLDCDLDTDSYRLFGDGFLLDRRDMEWFFNHYVPDPVARRDPRVSPLRAADFRGLAPALIVLGGCDALLDEGLAYAARLAESGVQTTVRRYDGMPHGFLSMPRAIPTALHIAGDVVADVGNHIAHQ
ncbi:alpha/beta hydrolase [Mycobacterium sp. SM3041]|uniref:alpha/beta hydrolase n=1 Tax=Mycobacterium sp. SM3041 TaxID=3114291 RepID=UPI00320496FF